MSDDKFQHTSHDLALVQDWLDAKGYGGEAKTVMDAMDLIASLRKERDAAIARAATFQRDYTDLFDKTQGTPCEQIRWQQERDALRAALRQAVEALAAFAQWSFETKDATDPAIMDMANDLRRARAVLADLKLMGEG